MKRITTIGLILIFSIFLGACNKDNKENSDDKTVDIYYVDSKTSGLVSESYQLIGTNVNDQINELLYMLQKTPKNAVYRSALPVSKKQDVKFSFDNTGCLIIDFTSAFNELSGTDNILCRAAVVKTLTQLNNVEYIQFSVEGQPLQDSEGAVRPLTDEDFVTNTEAETSYKAKLYYANKAGNKLLENITKINYTGAVPIEEIVIKQLIKGPTKAGLYRTIPEGTQLLNISKADGICTVDFNDRFFDKIPNVNENIVIYSIVNSLVELPNIHKVQFTINGKIVKTYWQEVKLDKTLEANLNLIKNPS